MFEPIELTDEELQQLCDYVSTTTYIYYPLATSFFRDMYNTGCRPGELLKIDLWNFISPSQITLQPFKGNLTRTFVETDLSDNLLSSIIQQTKPYQGLTLRQLSSVLKKIIPVVLVQTIDKSAIDYMFRYNKVKMLVAQGFSYSDIQTYFGWNYPPMAAGYAGATLYRLGPLPDYPTGFVINSDGTKITDNINSLLIYQ